MLNKISHSQPTLDAAELRAVTHVLKSSLLAQGKKVQEFEKKFSAYQKCKGAVAVNSGTSALHLALLALGIGKNDQVIMPSFVCTALLNAVNYVGATPKIVDVNNDYNISPLAVKKAINKRTKAIIVPHMFGKPADIKSLLKLKIPIIEDCAQALGAKIGTTKVGNLGVLSVFSFYATKVMTTGEGGMVTSNHTKLLNIIKDLRDYDNKNNYKVRYNYKMTDIAAAIGIEQLKKLPGMIKKRKEIASLYTKNFKTPCFDLPICLKGEDHIYFRYVVKTQKAAKSLMLKFNKKGISCCPPIFKPLHTYTASEKCPNAGKLYTHSISIPIYPNLTKKKIDSLLKTALK